MTAKRIHFSETQYGFNYGDAKVERLVSDEKKGYVILGLETSRHKRAKQSGIDIYVTRTGKVRIYSDGGEWRKP